MASRDRFDLLMRLYPADYRTAHADEIATTLRDAQDGSELRVGLRDSFSLAAAGIKIRMRSYRDQDWYSEVEHGVALGVRVVLFATAVGAAAFLWSAGVSGRSIYGGYDYRITSRLLFAAVLAPWIGVFVAQLYGWWRTALLFIAVGTIGTLALVYHKVVHAPFGIGPGTASALVMVAAGALLVGLGRRMQLGRVYAPSLTVMVWAVAVLAYASYLEGAGHLGLLSRPFVFAGVAFALVSIGMAIAGKPRGLIACAMLIFPAWMLSSGVFYIGFSAGYPEFVLWTLVSIVLAAALSFLGLFVAATSGRKSAM